VLSLAGGHAWRALIRKGHTISESRVSAIGEENSRVFDPRLARSRSCERRLHLGTYVVLSR
jgi:hypothetical protein